MAELKNKNILVVGGSSGIGLGIAQMAVEAGANVTIASRSQEKLTKAAEILGGNVVARQLDASDDASVDAFFADGTLWDHVAASAGSGGRGQISENSMAVAQDVMNAKFWAYYRVARSAQLAPGGSLTFISGSLGVRAAPGTTMICAINMAIEGMTRALALDFAPSRVNTISPGMVDTPLWDRLSAEDRQAMYDRAANNLPTRHVGQPADIAHAVHFVMTNPYTTGLVIPIEGGSLLQ